MAKDYETILLQAIEKYPGCSREMRLLFYEKARRELSEGLLDLGADATDGTRTFHRDILEKAISKVESRFSAEDRNPVKPVDRKITAHFDFSETIASSLRAYSSEGTEVISEDNVTSSENHKQITLSQTDLDGLPLEEITKDEPGLSFEPTPSGELRIRKSGLASREDIEDIGVLRAELSKIVDALIEKTQASILTEKLPKSLVPIDRQSAMK